MINDKVYTILKCRLCKSTNISIISKLAPTPIGDRFLKDEKESLHLGKHANDIVLCKECGQIQLSEVIEPSLVYDEEYLYTTDISIGLPQHFIKSTKEIINRFNIKNNSFIVEFGSNKGIMLKAFKDSGMRVLGVEPAKAVAKQAVQLGIETKIDFFTKELASNIKKDFSTADLIIANNVIANIPNLEEIAQAIEELLSDKGIFIFETSYSLDVFNKYLIDTIYHEHISYLSVKPLEKFFKQYNLKLFDVQHINTKGGSIRGFVAKENSDFNISENINKQIDREKQVGLYNTKIFNNFSSALEKYKEKILQKIKELKEQKERIIFYGASVGCTTMIYHLKLEDKIDFLIDDNPIKFNKHLPGTDIKVYDSKIIKDSEIKTVFVLAWRYIEPIKKNHLSYLTNGGKFININLSKLELEEIEK